jgi:hypothetical protein
MKTRRVTLRTFVAIQLLVTAAFAVSYAGLSHESAERVQDALTGHKLVSSVSVERVEPLHIDPLYDDPEVVSDDELAAVLEKILPRFSPKEMKPNFVEHALRTWGVDATFADPRAISGIGLRDVLIDHGQFLQSWNEETVPLLVDQLDGISIRYDRTPGGSVHHDHWLASLTEAGISRDEPVFTPTSRNMTINNVLQEALRDFRLDERETEWSAMAFGLWLPPVKTWRTGDGRQISFDLLAQRLLRGHKRFGVCSGTHRVYSMMVLLRLDDDFDILSDAMHDTVYAHLESVRDAIAASQLEDGSWPSNWPSGADAVSNLEDEPVYKKVIATGHHLEWLAIAPKELHPPREQILKAADWAINHTIERPESGIREQYTFYSHVGKALALWRGTQPAHFWREWRKAHPYDPADTDADESTRSDLPTDLQSDH